MRRRTRQLIAGSLAMLLVASGALAQDTLAVGKIRAFRPDFKTRIDTLIMFSPSGDSLIRGPMEITRMETTDVGNRSSYLVSSFNIGRSGKAGTFDSTLMERSTLGAIWHHSRARQTMLIEFSGDSVTGGIYEGDSLTEAIKLRVPARPYYNGTIAFVLGFLPLEIGYKAVLPVQEGKRSSYASISVTGRSQCLTASGQSVDSWSVDVSLGAGRPQTFWIDAGAGGVVAREIRISPTVSIKYLRP